MSQIKKELKRFLIVGFTGVGIDLTVYYILLNFLSTDVAKGISFVVGATVAFILNKYWTFEKHEKSYKEVLKFSILYAVTLGVNILTNKIVLEMTEIVFLAFLVATGVSTVLNFIGQKWWVFK